MSAVKRTLFSRVQGWLSSKQEPLQEPDGPPPPDAPPGPPGDMPDFSDSQEEAVAIALSLEGGGGSAEDVARENVARLQEFGCTSPKRGQGAGSSTDAPTPKTARTTPATGRMSSRTRGKAAMLVLADDDDDDGYVEIEGKSRRSRFVESARARVLLASLSPSGWWPAAAWRSRRRSLTILSSPRLRRDRRVARGRDRGSGPR